MVLPLQSGQNCETKAVRSGHNREIEKEESKL